MYSSSFLLNGTVNEQLRIKSVIIVCVGRERFEFSTLITFFC